MKCAGVMPPVPPNPSLQATPTRAVFVRTSRMFASCRAARWNDFEHNSASEDYCRRVTCTDENKVPSRFIFNATTSRKLTPLNVPDQRVARSATSFGVVSPDINSRHP